MLVKYSKGGLTRVAEMASHATPDQVTALLEIAPDAWKEITAYEADKLKVENQIKRQLGRLDLASVRALRAREAGTATAYDAQKLQEIESQAAELREELSLLDA